MAACFTIAVSILPSIAIEQPGTTPHPDEWRIACPAVLSESSGEPNIDFVLALAGDEQDAAFAHHLPVS
jgi:hypothetical protein